MNDRDDASGYPAEGTTATTKPHVRAGTGPVLGEDGLARCPWAAANPVNRHYHDTEWGLAVRGEQALFERICLESFQAGLSWLTILRKRPAFREAFSGFDADAVAAFGEQDVARLLADERIVRNAAKIRAAIANARAVQELRADGGLDALLWAYHLGDAPAPRTAEEVPPRSPASEAMAKDLRRRGFRFVGPTTAHALMEATGIINTHLLGCHRRGAASGTVPGRSASAGDAGGSPGDAGIPPGGAGGSPGAGLIPGGAGGSPGAGPPAPVR